MKPVSEMTPGELGAFIQTHLRKQGIEVVLSGGAAVGIYTSNQYTSKDLDLINLYAVNRRVLRLAMEEKGFQEKGRCFAHPDTDYVVEFPPGPLAIGAEPVRQIIAKEFSTGILRIISPTDCVKDRLTAYYHWGDRQCLAQANLVAQENDIDLEEVKQWSIVEGKLAEYKIFERNLEHQE